MTSYTFPPALPHGALTEVLPDIFFVSGTIRFPGPIPVLGSKAMTVVRHEGALTLINTLRLDENGLVALEKLGPIRHVVRLAAFHGMDDPFYKDRYGATVWGAAGQVYAKGFSVKPSPESAYFRADRQLGPEVPVPGSIHAFPSTPNGEVLYRLDREGGVVVSGDALQNWAGPDAYFNGLGRLAFRALGFFRPHNVGPGWLGQTHPDAKDLRSILDLSFEHVLPCHGAPVIGNAKEKYRPSIEAAAAKAKPR